jgi:hypothetical protein
MYEYFKVKCNAKCLLGLLDPEDEGKSSSTIYQSTWCTIPKGLNHQQQPQILQNVIPCKTSFLLAISLSLQRH